MLPSQNPGHSRWTIFITILLLMATTTFISHAAAAAATAVPAAQWQALQDKANEFGVVRVIVGLDVAFIPEGELDGVQAVQTQQQAIQSTQDQVWQALAGSGSDLIANFRYVPYMAVTVDAPTLALLATLPQVTSIQEDELAMPTLASSIPVIGADTAWTNGYTGTGQAVAILDTGVDKTHSFFTGGQVVSEACYSTTGYDPAYGHFQSVCPGGVSETTAVGSGIDCVAAAAGYPGAQDNCKHGTHVAGIAAGKPSSGPNFGVAKDSHIIAVQVFTLFQEGNFAATFSSDQIKGLEQVYALRNTFDIAAVNMSLGGSIRYATACDNDPRKSIIDTLRAAGIATVIASGNDGDKNGISAPACISSAISVGATDDLDHMASFSNIAPIIDLLAPGVNITSAVPGGGLEPWSGTSMAAPHVAGAWALISEAAPNATVDQILAAFKNSGTLVNDTRIGGSVMNIPRINVNLAITSLNNPTAVNDTAPTPLDTAITIDVLANDSDPNNDPITVTTVGTPGHGTAVTISASIIYTPTTGYSGIDTFTYTISDNHSNQASATVTVIVDGKSVYLPIVVKE